jgi:hypothetical protein
MEQEVVRDQQPVMVKVGGKPWGCVLQGDGQLPAGLLCRLRIYEIPKKNSIIDSKNWYSRTVIYA